MIDSVNYFGEEQYSKVQYDSSTSYQALITKRQFARYKELSLFTLLLQNYQMV